MAKLTPRQTYAIIGIAIGLFIAASTIPIDDNIDIITNIGIQYPLISDPKIVSADTEITAHTLFHLPSLSTAGIISSSNVKIKVIGGGKAVSKSIGTLYRSEEDTFSVVLPDVPPTTTVITVELWSGSTKLDSREVNLI